MDKLSELQAEAKEDLIILDDEDLHQQSYKNQIIKPKWLDYKSKYKLMMFQCKSEHKRLYREKWEYYGGKSDAKVYAGYSNPKVFTGKAGSLFFVDSYGLHKGETPKSKSRLMLNVHYGTGKILYTKNDKYVELK